MIARSLEREPRPGAAGTAGPGEDPVYHLARLFPVLKRIRLPLSRDQLMLVMAAINEFFLGLDIYLAHNMDGTIVPDEWIPIVFGPIAGTLLLAAGIGALRHRAAATLFANVVFAASIGVGLLGAYFHIARAVLPHAPMGEKVTMDLLIWAPPVLGPLTFALVGLIGLSAAWVEDPPDSGRLRLLRRRTIRLPYSKTRGYCFLVGMGTLATVLSSVLDHARTGFADPWLWVPTAAGLFGTVVATGFAVLDRPRRFDVGVYAAAMLLLIAVGVVGSWLHVQYDLTAGGEIVVERFLRGAPFLAPLLFSNMGALGLLALLDPVERPRARRASTASHTRR